MGVSYSDSGNRALEWATDSRGHICLLLGGKPLLRVDGKAALVGRGKPTIAMYRGNFRIDDAPELMRLGHAWRSDDEVLLAESEGAPPLLALSLGERFGTDGVLRVRALRPNLDRVTLRFA